MNNTNGTNGAANTQGLGQARGRPTGEPTHDVFDVVERDAQKPQWKKVGAAYANGASETVQLFAVGGTPARVLELIPIDRVRRPIRPFGNPKHFPTHDLVVGEGKAMQRVGVAFANKDGSLSLVIDEGLRDGPKMRLQLRPCRQGHPRRAWRRRANELDHSDGAP